MSRDHLPDRRPFLDYAPGDEPPEPVSDICPVMLIACLVVAGLFGLWLGWPSAAPSGATCAVVSK